jgi:hypothetical protein
MSLSLESTDLGDLIEPSMTIFGYIIIEQSIEIAHKVWKICCVGNSNSLNWWPVVYEGDTKEKCSSIFVEILDSSLLFSMKEKSWTTIDSLFES